MEEIVREGARAAREDKYNASLLRLYPLLGRAQTYTEILAALMTEVPDTLGYPGVSLGIMDEAGDSFLLPDVKGDAVEEAVRNIMELGDTYRVSKATEEFLRIPIAGDPMMEELAECSHIVVVEDALIDPRTNKEIVSAIQARTLVNVPLVLAGRLVGTLNFGTYGDQGVLVPDQQQLEYMSALANHVAVAMDRVVFLRQRAEAEDALRLSQRKLALHLEQTLMGVIEWDRDFRVREWNPAAEAIFGYTREEALGREPFGLILDEDARPRYQAIWDGLLRQDGGELSTNENITSDGRTILCDWVNTPLTDDCGHVVGVMSLARDVTERQRSEEFRVAKEAAEAASVAKSTFLANMSHEIRTPMNAILGFSRLMRNDRGLSERQRQQLDIINSSGEHLLALINDVLEMSKVEAGRMSANPSAFNIRAMLSDLGSLFGLRAQSKGIELHIGCSEDVPRLIVTDENKFRQILVNLLGNAVKFTERGSVELDVAVHPDAGGTLRLVARVTDTGRGIASEDVKRLFEYFEQAPSGQDDEVGTGLGLAISREFAQLLGGDVSAESEVGVGSTFTLDIPVDEAETGPGAVGHEERRVTGLRPGEPRSKILIADDTPASRELLVQLLEPIGFRVKAVVNGEDAVTAFREWRPDLILMDMHMPVMDGFKAVRNVRCLAGGAAVHVIAVTASAFSEMRQGVFDAGADDLIVKPFQEGELFGKIAKFLGVHYTYERSSGVVGESESEILDRESMASLSYATVARLRQATVLADFEAVLQIADKLSESDPVLASRLRSLADNFDAETILLALPSEVDES